MSKKKKNKRQDICMSDAAKKTMAEYGKEVQDFIRDGLRDPYDAHSATLPFLASHHATEGFKKGYEVGRREEREKAFNPIKFIEQFGSEASELARKYGLYLHVSDINMEAPGHSHPCSATVNVGIKCFATTGSVKEAFINWKD